MDYLEISLDMMHYPVSTVCLQAASQTPLLSS